MSPWMTLFAMSGMVFSFKYFWEFRTPLDYFILTITQVNDTLGFWTWMINTFAPAIYTTSWYNGDEETNKVYISDKSSILIGLPRIRQLRIKKGESWLIRMVNYAYETSLLSSVNTLHRPAHQTQPTCPVGKSVDMIFKCKTLKITI